MADDPEPRPSDPQVHRSLRWYWQDHDFPHHTFKERLRIERQNLAVLDAAVDEHAPEVVNWWAMGGMSLGLIEAVRRRGIPAVGAVHDDWMHYGPRVDGWQAGLARARVPAGAAERIWKVPARLDLGRAARWLFVSETVRRRALAAGWQLRSTGIAHSGVDTDLYSAEACGPWEGRLLCVGRLDPRKGVEVAIRALAHLPGARLRVIGSGDPQYRRHLLTVAQELDLSRRVELVSRSRAELPAEYARADAVLFPVQWQEPWGLVPLEAMTVGRPVVATGRGGSGEYLAHEANCLIYEPAADSEALAAAVRRLEESPELRSRLRRGGERTAALHTRTAFDARLERELAAMVRRRSS